MTQTLLPGHIAAEPSRRMCSAQFLTIMCKFCNAPQVHASFNDLLELGSVIKLHPCQAGQMVGCSCHASPMICVEIYISFYITVQRCLKSQCPVDLCPAAASRLKYMQPSFVSPLLCTSLWMLCSLRNEMLAAGAEARIHGQCEAWAC